MAFEIKTITNPKFDTKEIYDSIIQKEWIRLQNLVLELGEHLLEYIQTYINSRTHRDGKTGKLANAMKLDVQAGAGEAGISWGIGHIPTLNVEVSYWYLLNFGGLTAIAKQGRGVGGSFNGEAPSPTKTGTGVGTQRFTQENNSFFMIPKSPIRPMNYIEATRQKLNMEINKILKFLKTHN